MGGSSDEDTEDDNDDDDDDDDDVRSSFHCLLRYFLIYFILGPWGIYCAFLSSLPARLVFPPSGGRGKTFKSL